MARARLQHPGESGGTPTGFDTAIYFSGYSLTTLGTGDIVPTTGFYPLLMVLEALVGFSVLTMALTYFLSVYSVLTRRSTLALSLYEGAGGTADAAQLLAGLGHDGGFAGARQEIANMATGLLNLLESHHSCPVLHYFRFGEPYYSFARMALVSMDAATLIRTALDEEAYGRLVHSGAVSQVWGGGTLLLTELSQTFLRERYISGIERGSEEEWRERYLRAVDRLHTEGVRIPPDPEAAARQYVSLHGEWNRYVVAFAVYMGYGWTEVAPHESSIT